MMGVILFIFHQYAEDTTSKKETGNANKGKEKPRLYSPPPRRLKPPAFYKCLDAGEIVFRRLQWMGIRRVLETVFLGRCRFKTPSV